jgi:hypothetical protein
MATLFVAIALDPSANRNATVKPTRSVEMLRMVLPPSFFDDLPSVGKPTVDDNSVYHKANNRPSLR